MEAALTIKEIILFTYINEEILIKEVSYILGPSTYRIS